MKLSKPVLIAVALALTALPLLAKKEKKEAPQEPAPETQQVAAYLGDEPITMQEVEKQAAKDLMRLRQAEYDMKRAAVDQIVQQKLLDREAKARNVSLADLLKAEIDEKAGTPTDPEISEFYEKNKARMGGKTLEQAKPDIEKSLRQQKLGVRRAAFSKELMDKAQLRVMLEPPRLKVNLPAGVTAKGPDNAPVTLVEYSDYQCPFCRRAEPTVAQLLADYGDKIRFVYRDYPLNFHPRAMPASIAAYCAKDQGKYWEMHKNLMNEAGDLSDDDLKKRAGAVGLDAAAFTACFEAKKHEDEIKIAFDEGAGLGVTGTPSFFVNGRMIVGAKPVDEFKAIIDEEIARASKTEPAKASTK